MKTELQETMVSRLCDGAETEWSTKIEEQGTMLNEEIKIHAGKIENLLERMKIHEVKIELLEADSERIGTFLPETIYTDPSTME